MMDEEGSNEGKDHSLCKMLSRNPSIFLFPFSKRKSVCLLFFIFIIESSPFKFVVLKGVLGARVTAP